MKIMKYVNEMRMAEVLTELKKNEFRMKQYPDPTDFLNNFQCVIGECMSCKIFCNKMVDNIQYNYDLSSVNSTALKIILGFMDRAKGDNVNMCCDCLESSVDTVILQMDVERNGGMTIDQLEEMGENILDQTRAQVLYFVNALQSISSQAHEEGRTEDLQRLFHISQRFANGVNERSNQ